MSLNNAAQPLYLVEGGDDFLFQPRAEKIEILIRVHQRYFPSKTTIPHEENKSKCECLNCMRACFSRTLDGFGL